MSRTPTALAAAWLAACGTASAQRAALDPAVARAAAAYAAKVTASALFVSGRTLDSVLAEELAPDRALEAAIRPLLRFDVDREARSVTCHLGAATATAVATVDLGCTLVHPDVAIDTLRTRAATAIAGERPDPVTLEWPRGERLPATKPAGVDLAMLEQAIAAAFVEREGKPPVHTRAVVVVHRGNLVAERYAPGYRADMPLPGWSMSKTLVDALVGIRVRQGKLSLDAPLAIPEWRAPDDPRQHITLPDLLAMRGGLAWVEDYDDPASDALQMLFGSADHGAAFAQRPVAAPPGATFAYASGCSNLVCRILRSTFADDHDYWAFARDELFAPLGMHAAVLETDPSGTFVGSSYGFATARDWARFGMLYAGDGTFGDRRILPAGWLDRARTPVATGRGTYGSHLWLDGDPDGDGPQQREWPDLPQDLLHMDGHEGQYCVVFPTQQIVIVRLGCAKNGGFDLHGLLRNVLAACEH